MAKLSKEDLRIEVPEDGHGRVVVTHIPTGLRVSCDRHTSTAENLRECKAEIREYVERLPNLPILPELNSGKSKEDEIALLKQLAHELKGTQSYLASLLSKELVKWAVAMIEDDHAPDIFEWYTSVCMERDSLDARLTDELRKSLNLVASLRGDVERIQAARQQEKQVLEERVEWYRKNSETVVEVLQKTRQQLADAQTHEMALEEDLAVAQAEIQRLKEKLFDQHEQDEESERLAYWMKVEADERAE